MATIHIYDTATDKHRTIKANGKIKDIYPRYSECVVLNKGCRLSGEHEVCEDDVIFIREYPKGTVALAPVAIVASVVAIGVGVGAAIYTNKKIKNIQEQYDSQMEAGNVKTLPFLKGARNQTALGRTIPFMLGRNYFAPYLLNQGFYSVGGIDGKEQYWNAIFTLGYNNQRLESFSIGSAKLYSFDQTQSQDDVYTVHSDTYGDIQLEVCSSGELSEDAYKQKAIGEVYGEEIKHEFGENAQPIIKQLPENAQKVEVCIQFNGLRQYTNGVWGNKSVKVIPYWSNNADEQSPIWHEFTFSGSTDNVITKNSGETMRFVASYEFEPEETLGKNITIKLVRDTARSEDSTAAETCLLQYINTFCFDALKSDENELVPCSPIENPFRDQTLRIGITVPANENTENILEEINFVTCGIAKTFVNGQLSTEKTITRNPISCIMELLTSEFHPVSQYNYNELKTQSFLTAYNYCEDNEFYCDYIILNGTKKKDIIEKILSSIGASLILSSDGLLEIAIDKAESTPVALLNAQDIKSFSYAKNFDKQITGVKTTYTDNNSFQIQTENFMRDGTTEYDQTTDLLGELALDTVSTHNHAYKCAQRYMRQLSLQPRTLKLGVGMEGELYPLYSTVLVSLEQLKQCIRSSTVHHTTVVDGVITSIDIADEVEFVAGYRYGVIIQAQNDNGATRITAEVTGAGFTHNLTFTDRVISQIIPEFGNMISFGLLDEDGEFTKITHTMKIYDITPGDNHSWELTVKDYSAALYETGEIPEYKSNLTTRPTTRKALPTVTREDLEKSVIETNAHSENLAAQLSQRIDNIQTGDLICQADRLSEIYDIGEEGLTFGVKETRINVDLHQGGNILPFTFGEIDLPSGFTYRIDGASITIICGEGVHVQSGTIQIPILYRPIILARNYVDKNGRPYVDKNGRPYQQLKYAETGTTWNLYFSYTAVGYAIYKGLVSTVATIPTNCNIGDYIVWSGANHTASSLERTGEFLQGRCYKYIGPGKAWEWEVDESSGHAMIIQGDVLGLANADLEHNNSKVWEYMDHLTSNSAYIGMLVSKQAFIELLTSTLIQTGTVVTKSALEDGDIDLSVYDFADEQSVAALASSLATQTTGLQNVISGITPVDIKNALVNGNTFISGGYISTSLIQASAIQISGLGGFENFADTIDSKISQALETAKSDSTNKADTAQLEAQTNLAQGLGYSTYAELVQAASQGKTIIAGGYINTEVIDVIALKAITGLFTDIKVTGEADFTQFKSLKQNFSKTLGSLNSLDTPKNTVWNTLFFLGITTINTTQLVTYTKNNFPYAKAITINGTDVKAIKVRGDPFFSSGTNAEISFYSDLAATSQIDYCVQGFNQTTKRLNNNGSLLFKLDNQTVITIDGLYDGSYGELGQHNMIVNGGDLIQFDNPNMLVKKHYPAGTNGQVVYEDLARFIKMDSYVSCIGNYGNGDSSSFNNISVIRYKNGGDGLMTFYNHNETKKLALYSNQNIQYALNLCFVANRYD